jgi:exopolysaccharide biosynthesis polyprenyl glycosylphosphotransferase
VSGMRYDKSGAAVETISILERRIPERNVRYSIFKRLLDIVGSGFLLVALFPVMLTIAICVRLTSPGPVVFRQRRVGLRGRTFEFLKFRSMYMDAEQRLNELVSKNEKDGPIFKIRDDPRVTPVGKFLRKYSLDELPQLINVLRGDMSLVGPRPPLPREVEKYDDISFERLCVTPGISCLWQVCGRSDVSFKDWVEMDRFYIEHMSFWLDLKILLLTIPAVMKGSGAY